ncbi:hypothetical protein EVAR_99022_1 [Eumeta japonica]|uniref:Uncharacterized protein n=1 Tax=Eumeta variegata TaxID=151549 RepID=A0A4C1Y1S9_EUMVA|nr:hypothetical protein EVAR_99022_1 [Eumeta japonica]
MTEEQSSDIFFSMAAILSTHIHTRRTCGCDPRDNLRSRECDRLRKYLRQLVMPSRSRPTLTGANAGRPARVRATEHARRVPDRPARHGTVATTDVLTKRTGTAALRARRTLNAADAARLPHCGRRGKDFKLRTDTSGCSSPTGLTTLTRA